MAEKKKPDAVFNVGGKEFMLYKYYDGASQQEMLDYPDFDESPEYTDEGKPFRLAVLENCEYGRDGIAPEDKGPGGIPDHKLYESNIVLPGQRN